MQRLCESGKHGKMRQDSEHPVCLLDNTILEAYLRQAGPLCKNCYFREVGEEDDDDDDDDADDDDDDDDAPSVRHF